MNDVSKQPIDIEEQRNWLIEHKRTTGAPWSELAERVDIPTGTLSQFGGKGYSGNEDRIAQAVLRFRQHLSAQAQLLATTPKKPGFYETETSRYLSHMLQYAQGDGDGGRLVVAAMGAGTSKTSAASHYKACFPNAFHVEMAPSTAGVNNMQVELLAAMGSVDAVGTPQKLSRQIMERVKNRNALIIIDEAQHLSEKAIEEIRSWNDKVGVGIALFGNAGLLEKFGGSSRSNVYAQLFSRIGLRLVRAVPTIADVNAFCDAWNVQEEDQRTYFRKLGLMPGGLRSTTKTIELAIMMASADDQPLHLSHLQDAWAQLSSRQVAA